MIKPAIEPIHAATPDDFTPRIAELIWSEDPALMRLEFQTLQHWVDIAAAEWPTNGASNCYDATSLARYDGQVVGLINAFSTHEIEGRFAASETLRGPTHLDQNLQDSIDRLFVDPAENSFYVLDIAVHPTAQKMGVGANLMEHATNLAKSKGHTSLALDVSETNPALNFYKRLGFEIAAHSHVPMLDQYGVSAHFHMTRQISQ